MHREALFNDPDLARFYDRENRWDSDFDFCRALAADAGSVLDLGCGTGELAASLAPGRRVTGVDPARAMLDIAGKRPGGDRVDWVETDARHLRLNDRFDLVLLTGHAFQVFLTPDDRRDVLDAIARHLAPGGRFIFDSRNPAYELWKTWRPDASRRRIEHPELGAVEVWNDARHDPATGIVTYDTHYRILATGRTLSAQSRIAFPPKADLERQLREAGLVVDHWYGDWKGRVWEPTAPEIIPCGRLAV